MPRKLFRLRAAAAVAAVPVLVAIASHSVLLGHHVQLSVSGPAVLTSASTYHVTLTGKDADQACRVQETTTEQTATRRSATSYLLTVGLDDLPGGHRTLTLQAFTCRDQLLGQQKLAVYEPVHVNLASRWIAPSATDAEFHHLFVSVTTVSVPTTARIVRHGRTVAVLAPGRTHTTHWTWKPPARATPGTYTVEVTSGGRTASFPTTITKNWSPLSPPFPRCQTLTWTYDSSGQPARAAGMSADVVTAFQRISQATGIAFRRESQGGTIALGWKNLGQGGADGQGGATWSGDAALTGKISFNTQSQWVGLSGFRRYPGGFPGRGAMITHEIGHALGLGHVTNPDEVMYPVASNGSPTGLEAGDVAGLKALYRASSC